MHSSLTQNFPSSSSTSEDVSTLQQRLSTLSGLHNQVTLELAEKDKEIVSMHERLATLSHSTAVISVTLKKQAEDAERELRWAKEGRQSAERREDLAKREVEALRTPVVRFTMWSGDVVPDQALECKHAWRYQPIDKRPNSARLTA